MHKRDFLQAAAIAGMAMTPLGTQAQNGPRGLAGPVLLTVSGAIGTGNRGPLDPALDQMLYKQNVKFTKAHAFDFAALTALPAVVIKPTLEYDGKPHALKGPLLTDVVKASGGRVGDKTALLLRAVDGYAVLLTAAEATQRRFIVATHLDDRPLSLGGLGPLWPVYDADRFPDMAAKPLKQRFSLCPWATYHIEVQQG